MIHKRLILLLGIFLASQAPTAAPTPAPQIVPAQDHLAPIATILQTAAPPLLTASLLLYKDPGKSPAPFSYLFAGANELDHETDRLLPIERFRTLFFTQSSLPLIQLWSGRLQLDAFQSALHIQNMQFDPLGYGRMVDPRRPRQSYPGGTRSVHFSGLSLSFHFGGDARAGRPTQALRRLSRFVGTVLN